ncbi:hypothetical protein BDZ89DRAFT_1044054 [Hymenopellis radicata]|nr:hypothetical protein BDZ89DRAFT_1044054 [Hymenopellis radicata]
MRKVVNVFKKSHSGSRGSTAAIDWKGPAKVTWSGIEMLLKGAEKFLEGTPFNTPIAVITMLVDIIHKVSDSREDMSDMVCQIQKRLETINAALVQSEVANECTNEFAKYCTITVWSSRNA